MKRHQGLEDDRAPPKEDGKLSSEVEQESTPSASVDAELVMEEEEVGDHEFSKLEKHG